MKQTVAETTGKNVNSASALFSVVNDTVSVNVETFYLLEEIEALYGFKQENPLNKDNYKRLIGDYIINEQVRCCFEKSNGKLCYTEHKHGFIAELQDGSITLIGNCCAKNQFDAHAQIRVDRNRYREEKRRLDRLRAIRKLLEEKDASLKAIASMRGRLADVENQFGVIKNSLGNSTCNKLLDMAKTGSTAVLVQLINTKEYADTDGQPKTETRITQTALGSIKGTSIFQEARLNRIRSDMKSLERTYSEVEKIGDDIASKRIDELLTRLEQYRTTMTDGESFIRAFEEFVSNDYLLLCFLVSDKVERYKAARLAMEQKGILGGKEKAKLWLAEQEQALKKSLGAHKVGIVG